MSVLCGGPNYQALEATPTSTPSSPRVDADLAAKYNFIDNEDSGPPNFTSQSRAVDADLDFEHDRMTIVASWRAHANLLMLFSGLLSALIATQLLQACWRARPVLLPGAWVVCLARVFQLMGNAAAGAPGTLPLSPSPSSSRSLGVPEAVLPLSLPASTRALWLTSLVVGLGCTMVASSLKERACRDWRVTHSWRHDRHERKRAEYDAFSAVDGEVVRPMVVDMTRSFHAVHAFHLLSVALYLWGLGIPLVRASGPLALLVVGASGATFFIGQCLIVSALPRVTI